jgi:hypothetical protein
MSKIKVLTDAAPSEDSFSLADDHILAMSSHGFSLYCVCWKRGGEKGGKRERRREREKERERERERRRVFS